MPEEKKPSDPMEERDAIDPDVKEVMPEHQRLLSGRGPSVAKEAKKKKALARAILKAIEAKDERAFSEQLRRAGIKDGSTEWKKAWEICRSACGPA
jgi:hypothetical protein